MKAKVNFLKPVFALILTMQSVAMQSQFCSADGNVLIFTNYDGGVLNIIIDQNIPNLKIGICSYEAVTVNISGPFAGNVTEVQYAGFNNYNTHCANDIAETTINGVSSNITEILFAPPVTLSDPNGNGNIICAYSCGDNNQGGCNTDVQVLDYFLTQFGGELRLYYSQYGCWMSGINISEGGTCCPGVEMTAPVAELNFSQNELCVGGCVDFTDVSENVPTEWEWAFDGGSITESTDQNPSSVCYEIPGNYQVTLTATNIYGSTIDIEYINVLACDVAGCTYEQATNYNPNATVDDHSCIFDCEGTSDDCEGDFTDDGFISVADLIVFIGLYGGICP